MINFGQPTDDPCWHLSKTRLNTDYEAERVVKTKKGDVFRVHLKIEWSFLGVPLFIIINAFKGAVSQDQSVVFSDKPHFTPSLSSTKITTIKAEIFSKLEIAAKKNYPGKEFFGLL